MTDDTRNALRHNEALCLSLEDYQLRVDEVSREEFELSIVRYWTPEPPAAPLPDPGFQGKRPAQQGYSGGVAVWCFLLLGAGFVLWLVCRVGEWVMGGMR